MWFFLFFFMKETTLCFLIKDGNVLLGMKKRGFGQGKWNGFGGKLNEGEDIKSAVTREIKEEADVDVLHEDLQEAGTLEFCFQNNPDWDNRCHIFTAVKWSGEPSESEEMRPQWYEANRLPFELMWIDDSHWVPLVLAGKKIKGRFLFDDNGDDVLSFAVSEVHP
jgi:ADP-ribose pyrophosphatase YjhB (NUDIX family)